MRGVFNLPKFKFKSARKNKFNFIKDKEEIFNSEIIGGSHIEIIANKRITIEGCTNILDYQDDYIKLKLKKSFINILGSDFVICYFDENKIEVLGKILSIEFCV